ncbi:TetR family transcriptional regulator [Bacillus mangrovi]|uniref:TetR family transcriptional regulator n=1 Tax=Metabacillus mangrovi TaxID=1491830 RepID=A0A7X2S599_9BACI|nr:TetR/AcrR family transcriptional regulator [Metabacillus mangrovi]MTH53061.1 TetR family transcriptional regulator [Metabacillus mangrovi]
MPKFVDHHQQKELIAHAAFTIAAREGMEKVSVRKVAEEAGLSPGSMRHYFSSQSDLYRFTMEYTAKRIQKRAEQAALTGDLSEDIQVYIRECLPLTQEKRTETEVWLSFTIKALTDPELEELSRQMYSELQQGLRRIIHALVQYGPAKPGLDEELETFRFHALIDGLALHGMIHPEDCTFERMDRLIRAHIKSLCI